MRTKRYRGAAALAACVLVAVGAAVAGAAPRHSRHFRAITIHVQPNPITAGDPVTIFGRLFGRRHVGRLVVLFHRAAEQGRHYIPVQTTHTDATGRYEFSRADGAVLTNRSWFVAAAGAAVVRWSNASRHR